MSILAATSFNPHCVRVDDCRNTVCLLLTETSAIVTRTQFRPARVMAQARQQSVVKFPGVCFAADKHQTVAQLSKRKRHADLRGCWCIHVPPVCAVPSRTGLRRSTAACCTTVSEIACQAVTCIKLVLPWIQSSPTTPESSAYIQRIRSRR